MEEGQEGPGVPEGEAAGVPTSPEGVLVSAGLEERGSVLVPPRGLMVDGYIMPDGKLVPQVADAK